MAPSIGDSIKHAVENAKEAVEDVVETVRDKVTGHSDDASDETTVTDDATSAPAEPTPVVVATDAVSEPLTFEREDTDGNPTTLIFEPTTDSATTEHHTTTE